MAVRVVVVVGKMVVVTDIGTYLVSILVTLTCIGVLMPLWLSIFSIFAVRVCYYSFLAVEDGVDGIRPLSCF